MHPCSRGEVFPKESRVSISDYWPASLVDLDINVKESKALSNTLFSFGDKLRDARVDAYVDNQALVRAWQSQAARSSSFSDALKELSNRKGKTTVHKSACQFFGRKGSFSCLCPTRLAYETVDSLIGKLRALFNESGRRGEWDPRLLIGNPATDISLKQYLKAVTAEQLQAQITPTQATPVFVHDLVRLSHFLDEKLLSDKLSSIEMFVLMRDQASFKTLFFSGDRAGDLGQVKTPGNPPFPRWRWFTFQSHLGKNPP